MPSFQKPAQPVSNPFLGVTPDAGVGKTGQVVTSPSARRAGNRKRGMSKALLESRLQAMPMSKATGWSVLLHVVSPVAIAGLVLLGMLILSLIFNFPFWDFFKSKPKHDIQFTLVKDTQASPPEKPLFKGNFNQRAGGKRDPRQPLKPVEDPPSAPAKKAEAKAEQQKPAPTPPKTETPQPKKVPLKPVAAPTIAQVQAPEPEAAPALSAAATSGPASQASLGESAAGQGLGNPAWSNAQGGPGPAGVDVVQDLDYGPYMADLKKRIQAHWEPSRASNDRVVTVHFFVGRNGNLLNRKGEFFAPDSDINQWVTIVQSAGDPDADQAALVAIQRALPFKPLPPAEKSEFAFIEFKFEYNVLKPKKAKRG